MKKRMVVQLVFQIIFLLWPIHEAIAIAKPNCSTSCGNVEIPFPFGIGAGCYLDEWFEIECNSSASIPTPFLKRINLEVMYISVEKGTVEVKNPVFFSNCEGTPNTLPVSLETGSPFAFSQDNRFVAVACNNLALFNQNLSTVGGCMSICANSTRYFNGTCNGMDCCQTTIPLNLKEFNATFKSIDVEGDATGTESPCKYAFLQSLEWLMSTSTDPFAVRHMPFVPSILDWRLYNLTVDQLGVFEANTSMAGNSTYRCSLKFHLINNQNTSSLRCSCRRGFEGNPYLLQGCQDIDECMDQRACSNDTICLNRQGGYSCALPVRTTNRTKGVLIGLGSGLGLLFLLIGIWWLYQFVKKRRDIKLKEEFFKRNGGLLMQQQLSSGEVNVDKIKLFNSKELDKATDHFNEDRILGKGGQGTVYKGMLADGKIVAVKKSTIVDEGKLDQFINEVVILSQINHRNVVKILGCCLETQVPLLVYESIPNGTLFHYIQNQDEEFPMSWEMRLQIATEVAEALSYLHSAASIPIYHRDIKSTNILLDDKYRAKVSDFGTSKSVPIDRTHLTTLVQGTFGYLDPEYFQSGQFTDKSDVYSFGVVIVELLTGEKAISSLRAEEGRSLATYFILSMEQDLLFDIIDAQVAKQARKEEIIAVANLAMRCLNLNGKYRPTMKQVAMELEGIRNPQNPFDAQQNHTELEYVRTNVMEAWDVVSTSTGSGFDSSLRRSLDVQPLLSNNTR